MLNITLRYPWYVFDHFFRRKCGKVALLVLHLRILLKRKKSYSMQLQFAVIQCTHTLQNETTRIIETSRELLILVSPLIPFEFIFNEMNQLITRLLPLSVFHHGSFLCTSAIFHSKSEYVHVLHNSAVFVRSAGPTFFPRQLLPIFHFADEILKPHAA